MAMAFTCPHCGKQFAVAKPFVGQTGPCAGCRQPITILPAANLPAGARPAAARRVGAAVFVTVLAVAAVGAFCLNGALTESLLRIVQGAGEAGRQEASKRNVQQIGLALQAYHDTHGQFPLAVITDATGNPLYSGRVLLLPLLGQKGLYDQFHKDEPWDSPHNLPLSQTSLDVFRDPSSKGTTSGQTDYLFVRGDGTMFDGPFVRFADIVDGLSNTMAVVELKDSGISWAEPRDIEISQPMSLPPGNHPGGNLVLLADGSTEFIPKDIVPEKVRRMASRADKLFVDRDY